MITKKVQANGVTFGSTIVFVHEAEKGHRLRTTPKSVRKKGYVHDNALKTMDVKLAVRRALQEAETLAELVEGFSTQSSVWLLLAHQCG